jgi:hypothetical protein
MMTNSLEALIASIKPELKIALDKTQKQSDALLAIDRLSDLLTLPAVDSLIAALEQAQTERDDLKALNQHLDLSIRQAEGVNASIRRRIAELEASQLSVRLPQEFIELYGEKFYRRKDIEESVRAAGGTVGSE